MTHTLNTLNAPTMPIVGIPTAGIDAFVVCCAAGLGTKMAAGSIGLLDAKWFATFLAILGKIGGVGQRVFNQIRGAGLRCGVAFVAFYLAAHNFIERSGLNVCQAYMPAKLKQVVAAHHLARWGYDFKRTGVLFAILVALHRSGAALNGFGRVCFYLAAIRCSNLCLRFFGVFHTQLRFNIDAGIVELIARFSKLVKPLLFHFEGFIGRAILQWNKRESFLAIFVPRILQVWGAVNIAPKRVTMLGKSIVQTSGGAANVSRLIDHIQDHVNAGFCRVYVFHRWY